MIHIFSFDFYVVMIVSIVALITDLRSRMIYRKLTLPVFVFGLMYSFFSYYQYFDYVTLSKTGLFLLLNILWQWLGPVFLVFIYSLLIFWLGVLDGGDGQFLIAITPWMGALRINKVILYFYPVAFVFLSFYLLYCYKFNLKVFVRDQLYGSILFFKNMINRLLGKDVDLNYCPSIKKNKPPGMVAILGAVILSYFY